MKRFLALLFTFLISTPVFAQGFGSPNGVGFPTNGSSGGGLTSPVGISDGGTGQTTKASAFNALSPLTTQGDILYGGASGAGTRLAKGTALQYLRTNAGATAPEWATLPTTTGDVFPAITQFPVRSVGLAHISDEQAVSFNGFGQVFGSNMHTVGTATNAKDSIEGTYINLATGSTIGDTAGAGADGSAAQTWYQNNCRTIMTIRTGANVADIQNCRIWAGFVNGGTSSIPIIDNPTTASIAAFRYATVSDGTAFWRTYTSNGSASTVTVTTAAISADTQYTLAVDASNLASIKFYVNGTLVSTHTTNNPSTGPFEADPNVNITTLAAAAKNIKLKNIWFDSN